MYNVGDPNFGDFVQLLKTYHSYFNYKNGNINYDVIWTTLCREKDMQRKFNVTIALRIMNKNLLSTNRILNFYPLAYQDTPMELILDRY